MTLDEARVNLQACTDRMQALVDEAQWADLDAYLGYRLLHAKRQLTEALVTLAIADLDEARKGRPVFRDRPPAEPKAWKVRKQGMTLMNTICTGIDDPKGTSGGTEPASGGGAERR